MLSRIGSSFYGHGVSSEETLHYPNSDRSQGGRETKVAPSENHHIAFQTVLTADSLSLLLHPPGRVENRLTCLSMTEKPWKRWLNSAMRDAITDTHFSFLAERLTFGYADLMSDRSGKCAASRLHSVASNRRSFTQKALMCACGCGSIFALLVLIQCIQMLSKIN